MRLIITGWIVKELLEFKSNTETVQQGFKIALYARGPLYKPFFNAKTPDDEYIIEPQKKSVAIYAMGEERL